MSKNKLLIVMGFVSSVIVFLALFRLPYGYYTFLRWFITFYCICSIKITYKIMTTTYTLIYLILGILFNPFIPVYLTRELWMIIDIITGIIITVITIYLLSKNVKKES